MEQGRLPFDPAPNDVVALLQETTEEVRQGIGNGHCIEQHGMDRPCSATVDAQLLDLIVTNLLGNAAKYSPDGSCIQLVVEPSEEAITISVSDEGIGIPAA